MVNDFKAKGVRIDAIGMQAHWQSNDDPDIATIEAAFKAYKNKSRLFWVLPDDEDAEKARFWGGSPLGLLPTAARVFTAYCSGALNSLFPGVPGVLCAVTP